MRFLDSRLYIPFNYVALRYFNVAGTDPAGRTGQSTPNATHLIKIANQAALGLREDIELFGEDYDTPDGGPRPAKARVGSIRCEHGAFGFCASVRAMANPIRHQNHIPPCGPSR